MIFPFKEILNKGLEEGKNQTDILLAFEGVEPYIMGELVNKNDIVFEIVSRWNRRGPYMPTLEKITCKGAEETSAD